MIDKSISEIFERKSNNPHVNTTLQLLKGINGIPIDIKRAKGSKLYDVDKNEYIDFCLSHGAHILGHAPHSVIDALEDAIWDGTSCGLPSTNDTVLENLIVELIPSIEQVRLVSSANEAVTSAIRLARAFTGKKKIIKFDVCYHGQIDQLLVSNNSGLNSPATSTSLGVPNEFVQHTISVPFNNEHQVSYAFEKYKNEIAAIIVEPVPTNMGVVLPIEGFLKFLRKITLENNMLLIFDEAITGFRPTIGGTQGYFDIAPDITIFGNILGGGFSIGAIGGSKNMLDLLVPNYRIYQTTNPIAVTAGLAILKRLQTPLFYETLNQKSRDFIFNLNEITRNKGISINSLQSMFTMFFNDNETLNYNDVKKSDYARFGKFYKQSLNSGLFFSPSQFATNFISSAHLPADLNKTLDIVYQITKTL